MRRKRLLFTCLIVYIVILIGVSKGRAWEQVYKVIPDTTTWLYEWRYVGQVGVGVDTTTVNAFMHWGGLIKGTTLATQTYTFPTADGSNGQVPKTNGSGVVTWQDDLSGGGGASTLAIEEDDVQVSSPTATIDFRDGFDVTESPSYEANVVVDPDEVITAGTQLDWSGHTLNVDLGTGTITQAYDADLDDLSDGTLSASKIEDKFLRNDADDTTSYRITVSSAAITNHLIINSDEFSDLTGTNLSITAGVLNVDDAFLKNNADDSTNYKLTISSLSVTNRVGIGTTAPSSQFHIKANTPGTVGSHPAGQLIIQNPTDSVISGNAVITGYESDGSGNPDQQLWYLGSAGSGNSDILFLNRRSSNLYLGTNSLTRMTILNDGKVGIGTTSPGDKLTVYDTASSINVRVQSNGPDADAGVVLRTATAPYWTIYEDESNSQKFIIKDSVGGDRLTIDTSGNIGIGDTTPDAKLDVAGTIHSDYGVSATTGVFSGALTGVTGTFSGQVTSNSRKVTDTIELDAFFIVASTTIAGTTPVRISAYHDFAITITTMTVKGFGAATCVGMVEQRARASDNSAGTDIWSGDVTISTTTYSGETIADYTVPAGSALWFVPTSWAGDVDQISFDGKATKD